MKKHTIANFPTMPNKKTSDQRKILINFFLYYGMRIFVIVYAIIRLYLINVYLGVANLGLLNIMMLITPISLFLISSCQAKSNFILYKYSLKHDYVSLNKLINIQIKEMRFYAFISIFILGIVMTISYFFVNSPGISHFTACLLVFANSAGTLSFGLVLPYVAWYLNSLYLNYITDFWEICFATVLNIVVFIIISLFGIHVLIFPHASYEQGATYITLIISFLLSIRFLFVNIILSFAKKKYMPWFKKERNVKISLFSKNNLGYISSEFLSALAISFVPIVFFILSTFIHLSTSISGIYYSYVNFVLIIGLISWAINAVKPYLAKFIINNSRINIYKLNRVFSFIFIYITMILLTNFIIIAPYIMVFVKSYFNFWLAFLIGMCTVITSIKGVEEAFIYLDGRPEKYWKLTFYEIIVGTVSLIISFFVIFYVPSFKENIINLLYALVFCEMIMRIAKYIFNIIYLNKSVYHCKFKRYIRDYWSIYLFIFLVLLCIILVLLLAPYINNLLNTFTINYHLPLYSYESINHLFNDNIHLINYGDAFLSLILVNCGFIASILIFAKIFNPTLKKSIFNVMHYIKFN